MNEPSKITKTLIYKIHGGRKEDSKFWQSEFSNEGITKPELNQPNILSFFLYPSLVLILFITVYGSYYIYTKFNLPSDISTNSTTFKYTQNNNNPKISQHNYSTPTQKQRYYSRKSKDKPITKRELDSAISKAFRQRQNANNTVLITTELPYYRVELISGSVIRAKSAIKNGTHYTIIDTQGLEFSMQRNDIKRVSKIYPE